LRGRFRFFDRPMLSSLTLRDVRLEFLPAGRPQTRP
jgi:hypothetical protein